MQRTTAQPVYEQALLDALVGALDVIPAGKLLSATPKVELFTNNYNPTGADTYAAFTKAAFTGYAPVSLVFSDGAVNLSNGDQARVANAPFVAGALSGAVTVYGYIISDGSANVYIAELFGVPVNFVNLGDYLSLDLIIGLPLRYPVPASA
jgi:hypothetical protein